MNFVRPAKTRNRTNPLAYLLLAGLLSFQVGYAAHHSDHAVSDLTDTCQLCIQLDRSDQAVSASQAPTLQAASGSNPDAEISGSAPAFPAIVYRSRAPPLP